MYNELEIFDFLNNLKMNGINNPAVHNSLLQDKFKMSSEESSLFIGYWMVMLSENKCKNCE